MNGVDWNNYVYARALYDVLDYRRACLMVEHNFEVWHVKFGMSEVFFWD